MARRRKTKLTPEQKEQRHHKSLIRSIFRQTGFKRFPRLSDKPFTFEGQKGDFDDYFIYENILICTEYTTASSSNVSSHLKSKLSLYNKIKDNEVDFCEFISNIDENLKQNLLTNYNTTEIIIRVLYCSRHDLSTVHKKNVSYPYYLDYPELRYFHNLTNCIRLSAKFELLEFLDIDLENVGIGGKIGQNSTHQKIRGMLLPENNSNMPDGFKVVSFYASPDMLLSRAYVLRRNGWRDSQGLYQRLISKSKIDSLRKYLRNDERVYVNNIIATLPPDTIIVDGKGAAIDPKKLQKTKPVEVQVAAQANSIGLIDGQHRTFSYYESSQDDDKIAQLRKKQNLLVTGIVFPSGLDPVDREKFEAKLFLEINSTQTNAKSDLKQAIGSVLDPLSAVSIATRVVVALANGTGPLGGWIERYWFDQQKLKTTSIVSYGMRPLVKTSGGDSLFSVWKNQEKTKLADGSKPALLEPYIKFCVSEIDQLFSAMKANLPDEKWTTDRKIKNRFLTTTNVNCLLICLRKIIEFNKPRGFEFYHEALKNAKSFKFENYHSSQYNRMAEEMFEKYF